MKIMKMKQIIKTMKIMKLIYFCSQNNGNLFTEKENGEVVYHERSVLQYPIFLFFFSRVFGDRLSIEFAENIW